MENINLTSVNSETRAVIKKQTVSLLKKGKKHNDIAETLGISQYAADRISNAYKKRAPSALMKRYAAVSRVKNVSYHLNRKRKSKAY